MNLLLLNYAMDSEHPVLSHQQKLVELLSPEFDKIFVLTGYVGQYTTTCGLEVISTDWIPGNNLSNVFRFYLKFLTVLRKNKIHVVYSHMTTYQSLLILPITKFLKIKHFLWYAHKHRAFALNLIYPLISGILTSTEGSFPFRGKKIYPIGQGIDLDLFTPKFDVSNTLFRFIHIGRMDRSKGLKEIIEVLMEFRKKLSDISLTLVGSPSDEHASYYKEIFQMAKSENCIDWINILPAISRENIPFELSKSNIFIHNFKGSLDKTLLEATAMELDVVTTNNEYISQFSQWSNFASPTLTEELQGFMKVSIEHRVLMKIKRKKILIENHALDSWVKRTLDILKTK